MGVSTTLRPSAIHAAGHLPDLEWGPCAAVVAHRSGHLRIVQRFGRWIMLGRLLRIVQRVPSGRRGIWVLVHKNILLASVTKNNAPLTGSFPSGPRYKRSNGKDQVTNWVAPAKQKRPA